MINILHIEKSRFFLKSFRDIVSELDVEVFDVGDVDACFELLDRQKIDIIVTALSENDSLYSKIHKSKYEDIPILVLTSTDDLKTREKMFSLGIADYILKNDITSERLIAYFTKFSELKLADERGKHLSIAVLDDSHLSLKVIKRVFNSSEYTKIDYYSSSKELLDSKNDYTVYLIDLVIPNITGEEVMQRLRKRNPHAVIIIISGITNYRTISNILFLGADDYIIKPFERNLLLARINSHLRTFYLREDLEEKNVKLKEMAYRDGLTGLYNHKYIMGRLIEEHERAERYNHPLSVAMLDIDYFKKVNDVYGHPIGDEVLIEVSKILKQIVRQSDIVGRYGGEEFIIVFPECTLEQAYEACEHIRSKIEQFRFEYLDYKLTISGGVSEFDGQTTSEIISQSDKKLYDAKENGRNRIIK